MNAKATYPEDDHLVKIIYSFNLKNLDRVISIIRGIDPYGFQATRLNLAYAKTRNTMREIRNVL